MKKINMLIRKINFHTLLLFLILTMSGNIVAQNFKNDMGKIATNYKFGSEMEMKMTYNFYSQGKVVESYSSHIVCQKNRFYLNTKNLEVFNGNGARVMVAHESKEVIVMPEQTVNNNELLQFNLDSIHLIADTFYFKKGKNSNATYTIIFINKDKLELTFNTLSYEIYSLKKFSTLYNEESNKEEKYILEIIINEFSKKVLTPSKLTYETFVIKDKNKKWQLNKLYKNYSLEDFSVTQ